MTRVAPWQTLIVSAVRKCGALVCAALALVLFQAVPVTAQVTVYGAHNIPSILGQGIKEYGSVACTSIGNCTAVGPRGTGWPGTRATILTETAGSWGAPQGVTIPGQGSDVQSALASVSCWSVGNCVAVGNYSTSVDSFSGLMYPMVVDEIDGTWMSAQTIAVPSVASGYGYLYSVSCDAVGNCTAVGNSLVFDQSDDQETPSVPIVTTEPSGATTWTTTSTLPSPAGIMGIPTSISCSDAITCTALEVSNGATGADLNGSSNADTFALTETAGSWSVTPLRAVRGQQADLESLSCWSVGNCVAVGQSQSGPWPMVDSETDGSWAIARPLSLPLLNPPLGGAFLVQVFCPAPDQCDAVGAGSAASTPAEAPIVASDVAGRWSIAIDDTATRVNKPGSRYSIGLFDALWCSSPERCLAIGVSVTRAAEKDFWSTVGVTGSDHAPGAPAHVSVVSTPPRAVVAFLPPYSDGGSRIFRFTVTVTSKGERTRTCITTRLTCSVWGVTKGHHYAVTVTATNARGTSRPSPVRRFVAA